MSIFARAPAALLVLLAVSLPLGARDWPEPAWVLDPLLGVEPDEVVVSGLAQAEYNSQAFADSYDDHFQINALSAFGAAGLRAGPRVIQGAGLVIDYASYLMNGAVRPGDSPGSKLQWMMNAVQLEYGVYLAVRVLGVDLLADYARTSQHPLRDPYSQVASDLVQGGALRRVRLPAGFETALALRLSYSDLFDFWESRLPKPRARYLLTPALWLDWPLAWLPAGPLRVQLSADAEAYIDWAFLRGGGQGVNAGGRAGVTLGADSFRLSLYLDGYASDNTETRDDRSTPVGLLGWGLRLESGAPWTRRAGARPRRRLRRPAPGRAGGTAPATSPLITANAAGGPR